MPELTLQFPEDFMRLPIETRLQIWDLLPPGPRVIRLERNDQNLLRTTIPTPYLFQICRETRHEYLRSYKVIILDGSSFYFNVDIDVLYFSLPRKTDNADALYQFLKLSAIQYKELEGVKHVVLDNSRHETWRNLDFSVCPSGSLVLFLSRLKGLETFTIALPCTRKCCWAIEKKEPQSSYDLEFWDPSTAIEEQDFRYNKTNPIQLKRRFDRYNEKMKFSMVKERIEWQWKKYFSSGMTKHLQSVDKLKSLAQCGDNFTLLGDFKQPKFYVKAMRVSHDGDIDCDFSIAEPYYLTCAESDLKSVLNNWVDNLR